MKKYITLAALLAAGTAANAALVEIADMSELLEGSSYTVGEGVVKVSSTPDVIYSFAGAGIYGISNADIKNAIEQKNGFLTVAAWIKPTDLTGAESIFSWGGQNTGFKFALNGDKPQLTTKDVKDNNPGAASMALTADSWLMVAVSIDLAGDGSGDRDSYFYWGAAGYENLVRSGSWNTLYPGNTPSESEAYFGIGTGNADGQRDEYSGMIANLTVFTSESVATVAELKSAMGSAAPIPEPSAFGMLAGLGALALVASRRRRK
ncbi:MAG: PEP-CTERM sorting domain-containing protein [Verrucomicrobia bacterium]|nr:PEP-CTERM sorting domain-containing protein [Verrucomicrobiota bacterium]